MKVVYIGGPYKASNAAQRDANIQKASDLALEVWSLGCVALCPHINAPRSPRLPRSVWLLGDLELLRRCDCLLLVDGWELSMGTIAERELAKQIGLPIFESLDEVKAFAEQPCRS